MATYGKEVGVLIRFQSGDGDSQALPGMGPSVSMDLPGELCSPPSSDMGSYLAQVPPLGASVSHL